VVKYRKIPPAAAANQIAENARIPPAADLQKKKCIYYITMKNILKSYEGKFKDC
jgi:isocitrate dehydrogenase